jgi:HemX protein
MRPLILALEIALPLLYFGTIWSYAKAFFSGARLADSLKTPLLVTSVAVHALYVLTVTLTFGHPPITTVFEILSLIAFTIAIAYVYIEIKTGIRSTGYFILMLPFFFQLVSSIFVHHPVEVATILQNNLLGFHVSSALLGYAAITISGVYGLLYLMLYHNIKSSQFGVFYKRLPNLEMLERMSYTATLFGFALLSVAIAVGMIWLPRAIENFSYADPKVFGTLSIWIIYAIGLTAKRVAGWQGRRMIIVSLFGFIIAMFSITFINLFYRGFHNFY